MRRHFTIILILSHESAFCEFFFKDFNFGFITINVCCSFFFFPSFSEFFFFGLSFVNFMIFCFKLRSFHFFFGFLFLGFPIEKIYSFLYIFFCNFLCISYSFNN